MLLLLFLYVLLRALFEKGKEMGSAKLEEPDCILKVEAQRNGDGWIGIVPLYFRKNTLTFHEGGAI